MYKIIFILFMGGRTGDHHVAGAQVFLVGVHAVPEADDRDDVVTDLRPLLDGTHRVDAAAGKPTVTSTIHRLV